MKRWLVVCCLSVPMSLMAQEEQNVLKPVYALFEGMEKNDSAKVHAQFMPNPGMQTVAADPQTGKTTLRIGNLPQFLKAVGTPRGEKISEVIWSPVVQIDGNFAQVWAPYALYLGKTFRHCGVDAFQLYKDDKGVWRILNLADTRKTQGCDVPKEVSDRFK